MCLKRRHGLSDKNVAETAHAPIRTHRTSACWNQQHMKELGVGVKLQADKNQLAQKTGSWGALGKAHEIVQRQRDFTHSLRQFALARLRLLVKRLSLRLFAGEKLLAGLTRTAGLGESLHPFHLSGSVGLALMFSIRPRGCMGVEFRRGWVVQKPLLFCPHGQIDWSKCNQLKHDSQQPENSKRHRPQKGDSQVQRREPSAVRKALFEVEDGFLACLLIANSFINSLYLEQWWP